MRCPYCGNKAKLVTGSAIYPHRLDLDHKWFYQCAPCDAYVGCHDGAARQALGTLADRPLREARKATHAAIDPYWLNGRLSRSEVYAKLSAYLNLPKAKCHIAMFNIAQCVEAQALASNALLWERL